MIGFFYQKLPDQASRRFSGGGPAGGGFRLWSLRPQRRRAAGREAFAAHMLRQPVLGLTEPVRGLTR